MDNRRKVYRQGELLIVPITTNERDLIESKLSIYSDGHFETKPNLVLAEGEVTGHMHELVGGKVQDIKECTVPPRRQDARVRGLRGMGVGDMLLTIEETAELIHPEHNTVQLPEGDYVVLIQREYDDQKDRRVVD